MSKSIPSNKPITPTGVVFGDSTALRGEKISVFLQSEQSLACCALVHTFHEDLLLRFKPSDLVALRDLLDKAIKFMESR